MCVCMCVSELTNYFNCTKANSFIKYLLNTIIYQVHLEIKLDLCHLKKNSKDFNWLQFWSTNPMVIHEKNPKNGLAFALKYA